MKCYNFWALILVIIAIIGMTHGGFAATLGGDVDTLVPEEKFIFHMRNKVLKIISENGASKESAYENIMKNVVMGHFNATRIAKFVAGINWRSFSVQQQENFIKEYSKKLEHMYVKTLYEYATYDVMFLGILYLDEKTTMVRTRITSQVGSKNHFLNIGYQLIDAGNGRFLVEDVTINGVSTATSQREFMHDKFLSVGIDSAIEELRQSNLNYVLAR